MTEFSVLHETNDKFDNFISRSIDFDICFFLRFALSCYVKLSVDLPCEKVSHDFIQRLNFTHFPFYCDTWDVCLHCFLGLTKKKRCESVTCLSLARFLNCSNCRNVCFFSDNSKNMKTWNRLEKCSSSSFKCYVLKVEQNLWFMTASFVSAQLDNWWNKRSKEAFEFSLWWIKTLSLAN